GELRFDVDLARSTGAPVAADIDFQVDQLEQRLAELHGELEREQAAITDRAIALAADRGTAEDRLAALHAELTLLVDGHLPRLPADSPLRQLGRRLERFRAQLRRAQTGG
ncbi:MAG TPA: hypothetical protein VL172_10260, partial [Kofleriaceae bacterium]|nr:hypothetical protein [Kofleriaceae bacterium]